MNWFDRLYFGTWQFEKLYKQLSFAQIEALLHFALHSGIRRFDTAAVYGKGMVEEILGLCLPRESIMVTKVPALSKPNLDKPALIQDFYSRDLIYRGVQESLKRLRRDSVDTVLLHNWHPMWSSNSIEILKILNGLKDEGITRRVGISLPNGFATRIDKTVLSYIDVVEAPFNPNERWLLVQLPELLGLKKEVLLRSLFFQGKLIKKGYTVKKLLQEGLALNTSLVIGMTSEEQITQNIKYINEMNLK